MDRIMLTGGEFKPETIAVSGEKASAFFEGMFVDKLSWLPVVSRKSQASPTLTSSTSTLNGR